MSFVLPIIKMSEKTLKFDNVRVAKKEFHKSNQSINLDSVILDSILISENFKCSDNDFRYFIAYKKDEIVKPLCIIMYYFTSDDWIHKTL